VTAEEPMIVSLMRRQPTGEIRYLSDTKGRGMIGTSTQGFLGELDKWVDEIKKEVAVDVLDGLAERGVLASEWWGQDGKENNASRLRGWLRARASEYRKEARS
jgi:hypothetical protein